MKPKSVKRRTNPSPTNLDHKGLRLSTVATKSATLLENLELSAAVSTRPVDSGPRFGIHPLVTKFGDLEGDLVVRVGGKYPDEPADIYRCQPGDKITVMRV
jgi:hypothetical protein